MIGLIAFLSVYGWTPLNVTNDHWIMAGYDETDIIQHYAGWTSFRNSDWSFPLGLAGDMACEDGTYISYTDSIPWVAIFFKVFRSILPKTFQYFGLYTLLCFILQSIAAFKIVYLKSKDVIFASISVVFFTFAPIALERSMRHTGLGSQWLVLFAIYIFMKHRREYRFRHYLEYLFLFVLAIGIHPYFLPMIAVFTFLSVTDDIRRKKYWSVVYMAGDLGFTYLTGCILGVLGTGISSSRGGYGYFSMNLNAIINPTSCGKYTWSSLMKVRPQILGNYDGFNYLGVGALLAIGVALLFIVFYGKKQQVLETIKKNWVVIVGLAFCTAFAVSNVVTFNDKTLLTITLPQKIQELCGIFRASSRIFYPVYYCLYVFMLSVIWKYGKNLHKNKTYVLLAMLLLIQLYDLHACITEKYQRMDHNANFASISDDDTIATIMNENTYVVLDGYTGDTRRLAVAASKEQCKLYYSVANSGTYEKTEVKRSELIKEMKQTRNIEDYVIATTEWNTLKKYLSENNGYYEYAGQYFIATDKNRTLNHVAQGYTASSLKDDNWTSGINNADSQVVLFSWDEQLYKELDSSMYITKDSVKVRIVDIDYDETWIRVRVDADASALCYPNILLFE